MIGREDQINELYVIVGKCKKHCVNLGDVSISDRCMKDSFIFLLLGLK